MTVASPTSRVTYTGDGSTVTFTVPFYFIDNSDLAVVLRSAAGVVTNQALTTNYTATGAGNEGGGSITFVAAPAAGTSVVIYRDPPLTQTADYTPNGRFAAESHERALDRGVMMNQRTREIAARSLTLNDADTDGAGAFQARGNRITNLADPTLPSDAVTRTWAETAGTSQVALATLQAQNAAAAAAALQYSSVARYPDRATLQSATVLVGIKTVELFGYQATGMFGQSCRWRRLQSAPSPVQLWHIRSTDRFRLDGATDATNGGYWELVENWVTPQMMGATGVNSQDATPYLNACSAFSLNIRLPAGEYRLTDTWTIRGNSRVIGDNMMRTLLRRSPLTADTTQTFNAPAFGNTVKVGDNLSYGSAGDFEMENIRFYHFHTYNPGVTTVALNRLTSNQTHLEIWGPSAGAVVRRCYFSAMPFGTKVIGGIFMLFDQCQWTDGLWDDRIAGLKEGIACLYLTRGDSTQGNVRVVELRSCTMGGRASESRQINNGTEILNGVDCIGHKNGILVGDCEKLVITGGFYAGMNEYAVTLAPDAADSLVSHMTLSGVNIDESRLGLVCFSSAFSSNWAVDCAITGCTFNGQTRTDNAIFIAGAGPCVDGLTVTGCTFIAFRKAPVEIQAGKNILFANNKVSSYNCLTGATPGTHNAGNPAYTAAVHITAAARYVTTSNNTYGGGINNTDATNYCQYGEYWGSPTLHGWSAGNRGTSLGLAGGSVVNITQTYPA